MGTPPPVLIWSPAAAPLLRLVQAAGFPLAEGDARPGMIALVDARADGAGAAGALREAAAASVRLALVAAVDGAAQDRLIDAGATQIAPIGDDGAGLAQALRLAARSVAVPGDRRGAAAEGSALGAWIDGRLAAGRPVTVVHVALVRLDLVNAAHGRERGTALLDSAERRVAAQVAAVAEDDGMVARVAGPGVVAALAVPADRAVIAAARIEEARARPFGRGDEAAVLGIRLGLASDQPGETAAALLARAAVADTAVPAADDPLAVAVHRALARDEIAILFQPQAAMADARVIGVEALARWQHPDQGCLGAETLLAAADRAGIGGALADHIQRLVLAAIAAWPASLAAVRVALNVTAADLARPGFVETFLAHVDASGVARGRLTIEVTETEVMTDLDLAAAALGALQEAGCRTAIDDFGTGYSSLAWLATLPIDYLKLDRTLAQAIGGARRRQVVVRAAIEMARSLGIAVIAEGVETEAQRAALAEAGCALYQGFLLAPPLSGEELATMMEEAR